MSIETLYKPIEIAHGDMCYQFCAGNDELVFFIHGIGCNKASFKYIWEANEVRDYTLLAVDLMGMVRLRLQTIFFHMTWKIKRPHVLSLFNL